MANSVLGITMPGSQGSVDVTTVASDVITTLGNHGFRAGDVVTFFNGGSSGAKGYADADLDQASPLYVIATGLTDTTFKVSDSYGGSALTLSNLASCRFRVAPDVRVFDSAAGNISSATLVTTLNTAGGNPLAAGATSVIVADASKLPAAPFVAIIEGPRNSTRTERWERVLVTAVDTNTLTVIRGYEGTADTEHTMAGTSGTTARKVWARSLAWTANAMANLDWREASIRTVTSKTTEDSYNGRLNQLFTATSSGDAIAITAHGLSVGDRIVFLTKNGGANIRLGHSYYVHTVTNANSIKIAEEYFPADAGASYAGGYTAALTPDPVLSATTRIRRLTVGGSRRYGPTTTFYPRLWGWMMGMDAGWPSGAAGFDITPLTARLHFDAITDRGAQNVIHFLSMTDQWVPEADRFGGSGNITKLGAAVSTTDGTTVTVAAWGNTINGGNNKKSAVIVSGKPPFGAFPASGAFTIRVDDEEMRVTSGAGTTSLTVTRGFNGTTAATHANGARVYLVQGFLVKFSRRAQYESRYEQLAGQIAAADGAPKVIIRPNYEFETKYMSWTSAAKTPAAAIRGAQVMAYDAGNGGSSSTPNPWLWKYWWRHLHDTITAVASNAKFWWCTAHTYPGTVAATEVSKAYPGNAWVDYVGFDYYVKANTPGSSATNIQKLYNMVRSSSSKPIIIGELGHYGTTTAPAAQRYAENPSADDAASFYYPSSPGSGGLTDPDSDDTGPAATGPAPRATWLVGPNGILNLIAGTYRDRIVGVMYYDLDMSWRANQKDWSLHASPTMVDDYTRALKTSKWRGSL